MTLIFIVNIQNQFQNYVGENVDSLVQMTLQLSTHIWTEKVIGGAHKGRVYVLGSQNDVRWLQSGLERIGSSSQVETLDSVQIAAMSDHIAKLTTAYAKSKQKRVVKQQSMSKTL